MSNYELAKFTASIDAAWKELHSFLAAVTPSQASKRDQGGWSVKDHVAHLVVWEDSVVILFRGGLRHEALGIEEPFYAADNFDEVNEVIKVHLEGTALQEAMRNLEGAHRQLMSHLRAPRDADLNAKAREFFPQAPRNDDRSLASSSGTTQAGTSLSILNGCATSWEGPPSSKPHSKPGLRV